MKPEVFPDIPFPGPEFSQSPFESVSVPVRGRSFLGYSSSPYGNASKIFDNSFVCVPVSSPEFSPIFPFPIQGILARAFGQSSPILMNCVWVNFIHIQLLKQQFVYLYTVHVYFENSEEMVKRNAI
jgi:hypothetical protein